MRTLAWKYFSFFIFSFLNTTSSLAKEEGPENEFRTQIRWEKLPEAISVKEPLMPGR